MEARGGRCLCGAVRFTARPTSAEAVACHCGMSRRWSGGTPPYVQVEDVAFEPGAAAKAFASSGWGERLFCPTCGTSVDVSVAAFDPPIDARLALEIFIDEKPAGYAFAGETRKMTGAEIVALFPKAGD